MYPCTYNVLYGEVVIEQGGVGFKICRDYLYSSDFLFQARTSFRISCMRTFVGFFSQSKQMMKLVF
jgi:hypothetical protein